MREQASDPEDVCVRVRLVSEVRRNVDHKDQNDAQGNADNLGQVDPAHERGEASNHQQGDEYAGGKTEFEGPRCKYRFIFEFGVSMLAHLSTTPWLEMHNNMRIYIHISNAEAMPLPVEATE